MSLYFIIDNELISDQDQINSFFDILIDQTPLDNEIKNLVIYKKALYNADESSEGDLLRTLNPLINSKSGISKITQFDVENYPCKIAGSIDNSKINEEIVSQREQRKIDRFITLGLIAD